MFLSRPRSGAGPAGVNSTFCPAKIASNDSCAVEEPAVTTIPYEPGCGSDMIDVDRDRDFYRRRFGNIRRSLSGLHLALHFGDDRHAGSRRRSQRSAGI